jgi:hypothetical protein
VQRAAGVGIDERWLLGLAPFKRCRQGGEQGMAKRQLKHFHNVSELIFFLYHFKNIMYNGNILVHSIDCHRSLLLEGSHAWRTTAQESSQFSCHELKKIR